MYKTDTITIKGRKQTTLTIKVDPARSSVHLLRAFAGAAAHGGWHKDDLIRAMEEITESHHTKNTSLKGGL